MTWENSAISITTLLPILGAVVIVLVPRDRERLVRGLGILFTGAALVLAVAIGTGWTGGLLKYVQSGNVQRYAILLFTGVAILAVVITRV